MSDTTGGASPAGRALDHPQRVTSLAALDSVPILEALQRAGPVFAESWWHWFFFGASPHAERVVNVDPLAWYRPEADAMGAENYADMVDAVTNPATVRAMIEDYRAGLHLDRRHDEEDRAQGRQIECPTLVAWSRFDDMENLYGDPAEVWRPWCRLPVASAVIDSGHHMAEENPRATRRRIAHASWGADRTRPCSGDGWVTVIHPAP